MKWTDIIGQQRVARVLDAAYRADRVAGAYLLHGPEGVGKDAVAMAFASLLVCERPSADGACGECDGCRRFAAQQHPGVRFICALPSGKNEDARRDDPLAKLDPDALEALRAQLAAKWSDPYHAIAIPRATEIKMSSVRDLNRDLSLTGTGRRVVIISRAETMNDESQNALLKTLEEPPPHTVFLLTTAFRDRLKSTVRSRCQQLRCDPLADELVVNALVHRDGIDPATARACAELAGGSYGVARSYAGETFNTLRERAVEFLRAVATGNATSLYTHIDEIARARDRVAVEQFLLMLLLWFRDAEAMRLGAGPGSAGGEALQRFVARYPAARNDTAIRSIETAVRDVRRNANLSLALRALSVDLFSALS